MTTNDECGSDVRDGITGRTRLLVMIGDPIVQVRAPMAVNKKMMELHRDFVMVPLHVSAENFERVIGGLRLIQNLAGILLTMPHKSAMVPLLDHATAEVQQAEACNVICRTADGKLRGTLLDGEGFVSGLRSNGVNVAGTSVLLVGAGGAAAAIAFALVKYGVCRLAIANRTQAKAQALVDRVRRVSKNVDVEVGLPDPQGYDIAINATSAGMKQGDPLPMSLERLEKNTMVADVIVEPELTPLLAAAQKRGCRIQNGRPMVAGQIELMIKFFGTDSA